MFTDTEDSVYDKLADEYAQGASLADLECEIYDSFERWLDEEDDPADDVDIDRVVQRLADDARHWIGVDMRRLFGGNYDDDAMCVRLDATVSSADVAAAIDGYRFADVIDVCESGVFIGLAM